MPAAALIILLQLSSLLVVALVIGQADLYEWARHHVYDFRLSPQHCAVSLNYSAPRNPTLQADFFNRELADYPNQQL